MSNPVKIINGTKYVPLDYHAKEVEVFRNKWLEAEAKKAEVRATQQMVDYYAKEFRKGYRNILSKQMVEASIKWLQKEAGQLQESEGEG